MSNVYIYDKFFVFNFSVMQGVCTKYNGNTLSKEKNS